MSDRLRTREITYTFGGEPIQQVPSALYWIDRILVQHRVGCVLELGTGVGALTGLFALHCPDRVVTCDNLERRSERTASVHRRLGVLVNRGDLYAPATIDTLIAAADERRIKGRPLLLLCDGGDKHREFEIYPRHLQGGDLVLVHDRGSEYFPDSERALNLELQHGLERVCDEELVEDRTLLTAYRKRP